MIVRLDPAHVTEVHLGLIRTPASRDFKLDAGQNNHFLITVLVGIDSVYSGKATLSDDFSTTWNPKDVQRSAIRSRQYSLKTTLAWITDLVDIYRRRSTTMTSAFTEEERGRIQGGDGRAARLRELARVLEVDADSDAMLLVQFGIQWRNSVVHSSIGSKVGSVLAARLRENEESISRNYRGLDICRTLSSYEKGSAPTFKEISSIIAASHRIVEVIDRALVSRIDMDRFAEAELSNYFRERFSNDPQVFAKTWPGSAEKTLKRLTMVLGTLGFVPVDGLRNRISSEYVEQLLRLSARGSRERFASIAQ